MILRQAQDKSEFGGRIVAEAMSWIGTPFHPQASVKGVGCDCKGLVAGVAREIGLAEGDSWQAGLADYDIQRVPVQLLSRGLSEIFDAVTGEWQPGDVLLLTISGREQHLAIYAGVGPQGPEMIHCWSRGLKQVVRCPIGSFWKVSAVYRWQKAGHVDER